VLTAQERTKIAEEWLYIAMLYEKELSLHFLNKMIDEISSFKADLVLSALRAHRQDYKNKSWPRPSDIKRLLEFDLSDSTKAEQVARLIPEAISKFGWPRPSEARAYIGEVGWTIVQSYGGWLEVCSHCGELWNRQVFHAQVRESAKAILESSSLEKQFEAISYSEKKTICSKDRSEDIRKLIHSGVKKL
jgi:hypothetical protein